jgi:hypothetical protein
MSPVVNMTNGKCIAHPFFKILKILDTNFFCRSVIEMHCVENLFCVVFGACTHQFQEAKGPEAENQLRTALGSNTIAIVMIVSFSPTQFLESAGNNLANYSYTPLAVVSRARKTTPINHCYR